MASGPAGFVTALHVKAQVWGVYQFVWASPRERGWVYSLVDCRPTRCGRSPHIAQDQINPPNPINQPIQQLAELGVYPDYRFYAEAIDALWRMQPLITMVRRSIDGVKRPVGYYEATRRPCQHMCIYTGCPLRRRLGLRPRPAHHHAAASICWWRGDEKHGGSGRHCGQVCTRWVDGTVSS